MSPIEQLNIDLFQQYNLNVWIKRDDLLHPIIAGNKWRKLKYNILEAKRQGYKQILSFGGAYSNHLHALAYACKINNLHSIGIVRGEQHYANNYTLRWARHWGMTLKFVDRITYKLRDNPQFINDLQAQYPEAFIVPEGGSNSLALTGIKEVIEELDQQLDYDYLITPVGSGGTLAGLIAADNNRHHIRGVAVLKQHNYLQKEVLKLLSSNSNEFTHWQILDEYHCGGYGRYSPQNAKEILAFSQLTSIPFEPVYSGKMVLALLDLTKQGYFKPGSTIVLLHTGGLQGLGGMAERGLIKATDWPVPAPAPNTQS